MISLDKKNATVYAKFAMGPLSVGYQEAYQNSANGAEDNSAEFMGIAYTAGDLSVSYGESQLANEGIGGSTVVERQLDSVQAAYTMGGATVAIQNNSMDNVGGTSATNDEITEVSLSLAF